MKLYGKLVALMIVGMLFADNLKSQETIIFNKEIEWTWPLGPWYGGNSFYWWHRTVEEGITDYGDMSPTSWEYPDDYRRGEVFLRYEILYQPTSENFRIQLGIWQDHGDPEGYRETVSNYAYLDGGTGYVIETSLGSPKAWWQKRNEASVDFSRPEDFYRIGIVLWQDSPLCLPMAQGWNNDNACSDASTGRLKFFPMQARVTVVAVAEGHTFSGWENYRPDEPTMPDYGVNYIDERTNVVVASTDEYSVNADMTGAISGTDTHVNLNPGQDLYFRTKADGGTPASEIQHLVVKARPQKPAFTASFANEQTQEALDNSYEYSAVEDFSTSTTGSGNPAPLIPGSSLFIRKKATLEDFQSEAQRFDLPERPAAPQFGVSFLNETTEAIPADHSYSVNSDMSGKQSGSGVGVALAPGETLYIQKNAGAENFSSEVQTLVADDRPAGPQFHVNFLDETTLEAVPASVSYSISPDFSSPNQGAGSEIPVSPGTTIYFKTSATAEAYLSMVSELTVPGREMPSVGIDYIYEKSDMVIPASYLYGSDPSMSDATPGTGIALPLTTGTTLYFQQLASTQTFLSEIQELNIPERPQLSTTVSDPVTSTPVPVTIVFSESVTGFSASDINVQNGTVEMLEGSYTAHINPLSEGNVDLFVPANVVNEGNFTSFILRFTYQNSTGIGLGENHGLDVYPTLAEEWLRVESNGTPQKLGYDMMDLRGVVLKSGIIEENSTTISVASLPGGLYIIHFYSTGLNIKPVKFIKK